MEAIIRPFTWFYHEFGLDHIHATGRNAYLVILSRSMRMLAHGAVSLFLALYFAELKITDQYIGLFMTLTLLGDVILGIYLTLIADRFGRRNVLLLGSTMMMATGIIFAVFENYWILLIAAVIGVVSATGGDFGPFRSIEESIIYELTETSTRADVLAWYVTFSTVGSSLGNESSGRIIHYLEGLNNWSLLDAYRAVFWIYAGIGAFNAFLAFCLTKDCEMKKGGGAAYELVHSEQDEENEIESNGSPLQESRDGLQDEPLEEPKAKSWHSRFTGQLSQVSASTFKATWKLMFLLAVDSISDGMAAYPLTNYYMDQKFHPRKSTLGDIMSVAYFLGAISSVFAGPLARRVGLINAMVWSHAPSSASILFFPMPNNLPMTVVLLFTRAGLNNMDQAPRGALIAALTPPEERTAVLGIMGTLRMFAAMPGPWITGNLASIDLFGLAFSIGGSCRLAYDLSLYVLFRGTKL
ncbi:major facilitator superfamily domain-containing protein [Acrodontium crateriforme]|uniref:Major facilitator superfamily domain-containing protein n=1 Tax=Acrodontium crateriforme TaxID=150365 RepID=A0AAQ3R4P7_9PEZI|nr:major facilitator superfamily domain-containing protein [Acrodontium crateriforme]